MLVVRSARGPRRPRKWRWVIAFITAALIVAAVCCWIVIKRAEPILRTRVIETLSARFKSRVDLAEIHVSIYQGLHVEGKGLKIYGVTDPNPSEPGVQPLLQIGEFQFSSSVRSLFREPMRVDTVFVNGLTMNIPPKNHRQQMPLRHHIPAEDLAALRPDHAHTQRQREQTEQPTASHETPPGHGPVDVGLSH